MMMRKMMQGRKMQVPFSTSPCSVVHHFAIHHFAILPLLSLVLLTDTAVAEDDQVMLRRGGAVRGKITGSTPTQVTMTSSSGQTQTINVNEIRLVSFGDEPQELRQGRARAVGGKFEDCLVDLGRVDPRSLQSQALQLDLQFYLALAQARLSLTSGGDKSAATDAMLKFVRAAPTSYHFIEAAEVLGDLSVAQSDFASAVKYYGAIASKAPWPETQMRATLMSARALIAQEKFDEALAALEGVLSKTSNSTEAKRQKLLATIGRGLCLANTGSQDEGIQLIEELIRDNDSSDMEVYGRAYNALGDCYQAAGRPKEALMAYLHVDVLFYSDPEIHAESLAKLTVLWEALKKPDRAAATRNLLEQRYPGSFWASQNE